MNTSSSFFEKLIAFTNIKYAGNTIEKYLIALLALVVSFLVIKILFSVAARQLKKFAEKTELIWDDFIIHLISVNGTWLSLLASLYIGTNFLKISKDLDSIITSAFVIITIFVFIRMASGFLTHWFDLKYFTKREEDIAKVSIMRNMLLLLKTVIWAGGILFILDNIGFDITTAVAGLGIGGIAIALASQNILGDVFSYFTIFFDKPFQVGDYIVVEGNSGTVQHIGIKTTRIRSLQGEQLVYGNSHLIKSCIQNFKRLQTRRVCLTIGVTYETSLEKLKMIPKMIESIVTSKENVTFDRAHFKSLADFSLVFEFVYYINSPAYIDHMDCQQSINYQLMEEFAKQGIEFAYPTQTLHLNKMAS